jgi:triacylglycerol lipase
MTLLRTALFVLATTLAALSLAVPANGEVGTDPPPPGANDFGCKPSQAHPRPVILLHGLSSTKSEHWGYMSPRIAAAGYCVFAITYGLDPITRSWPYRPGGTIRIQKSAKELRAFVARVRRATGARRVDLVGHSEGTIMPRWYLERLGGARYVKRFVALTPLWRGTEIGGAALLRDALAPWGLSQPLVDAFADNLCAACTQALRGSDFLRNLNRDGERIPGIRHTNIVTATDELVIPYTSGIMADGGKNIVLQDVGPLDLSEHLAVANDPVVLQLFLNALDPKRARPVRC